MFLVYSWWQSWLARWHRWGRCMANHPSVWATTLTHPLHLSPLSHSLNPHWEGEGENLEVGEDDEEEGSRRTGQRLHWHPWESADPFSGNYQHQCREAVARRGAGARGCGRVLGGCGWVGWGGGGGISPIWKSWHGRRAKRKGCNESESEWGGEVERGFIFNYGKDDVSLTLWASTFWFRAAFPFSFVSSIWRSDYKKRHIYRQRN